MSSEAADEASETYSEFIDRVERLTNLGHAGGVLGWDQEVMMPEGGTPARSKQRSAISTVTHELLTSDEMAAALDDLEAGELSDERASVVREVRRQHDRAASVPQDLVEEISEVSSEAMPVWQEAKEEDDFSKFAPTLERLVELKREYAEHIDPDRDPYEVLFEEYEPYLGVDTAERVLERLREELVPLVEAVRESDADLATDTFEGEFDTDTQEDLARDVLDTLGYDWDHGRLDTAPHPFSSGNQFDARVTTRFSPDEPLGALMATVHEFGHATYTLGLPREEYGTPLGKSRDMTVHESQSRLWENHVGRSRAFWERFLPKVKERFPEKLSDASVDDVYEAANEVYEDNLIRVEADELTYHMHIIVRFEIERDLIRGDLDVEDVPEVWNDKYEEYLGIRPDSDAEGCLQDIHWSHGDFGYFPTYSLGSVLATQLYASAEEDIENIDEKVAEGDFDPLHDWLTENVHRHGCRYTTDELIRQATGEDYTADYFLDYVKSKYGELYELDDYQ
ncbi:carboxypeptidase M32 [Halorussus gelatinilyticus]|uniref:Metal-dependent carboxypeptidase n=1 Tax=Halorussus gelatinilyticus TaxID=2937524 RepID=A0A8U0IDJ6_9EURY|nr:carboxypeptidase M32 [Halorussus gelatinilyticus]UPV98834.1 carboxypeptidase M32 [Halorussus gelatinilyticus]